MLDLSKIQLLMGGAVAIGLLLGGLYLYVYSKGETAGSSAVTTKVQQETIKTLDAARARKDKADAETRSVPYSDRVDGLR